MGEKLRQINVRGAAGSILIFILVTAVLYIIVSNDYALYSRPIGKIINVQTKYTGTKSGTDGTHNYKEKYYKQKITAILMNGSHKGEKIRVAAEYSASEVYNDKYSPGDRIFIDNVKYDAGTGVFTGSDAGTKRDQLIALVLCVLFGLFLLVGGRKGALTIFSLLLNMVAFYGVLKLYLNGVNILALTIPMAILFTFMLLFFMYGIDRRSLISAAATLASCAVTTLIAVLVIRFGGPVDYDFMDYLAQPYEQSDADLIFISEILIGSLGAVMDVVVTMVVTVDQISKTGRGLTRKSFVDSCREVADDLVGTMINLMFFSNIAAGIPMYMLCMRNGIEFRTILRYNVFFEVTRFLTGSIGIVLAVPVSAFTAIRFYRKRTEREKTEQEQD